MSNPIKQNFTRRGLNSLDCVLLGIAIENYIQFGNFRDPAAINLSIKLDGKLH